jgi:Rad3-related DNA helicase
VFVEEGSKKDEVILDYKKAIDQTRDGKDKHDGGVLFSVCRGSLSENYDLSDHYSRCVVVLGVPYPNTYDPKVKLHKEYLKQKFNQ